VSVSVDAACGCEDCSGLREGLSALAGDGSLPDSLVHDDGQPIVVEVGDVSLTVAEARLRLALVDPNEPADEIRRAIARLREHQPGEILFADRHRDAAKLLAKLDSAGAR
jgi:hypothetical protein